MDLLHLIRWMAFVAVESERECVGGRQGEIEVRVSPMREKPVQAHGPVGGEPTVVEVGGGTSPHTIITHP